MAVSKKRRTGAPCTNFVVLPSQLAVERTETRALSTSKRNSEHLEVAV